MNHEARLRQKITELQEKWNLLSTRLTGMEKERILETRSDERGRLDVQIKESINERKQVEEQLNVLEAELIGVQLTKADHCIFYREFAPSHFMEQIDIKTLRSIRILCFTGQVLLAQIKPTIEKLTKLQQRTGENFEVNIGVVMKHPTSEAQKRARDIAMTVEITENLKEYQGVKIQYRFYQGLPAHRGIICEDKDKNRTAYLSAYEWLPQKNQASPYAVVIEDSPEKRNPMIDMLDSWISHYWGKNDGKIHTIIFDFDDTLASTMKIQIKAWIHAIDDALSNGEITLEELSPEVKDARNDLREYYNCIQEKFIQYQMADKIIDAILPGLKNQDIKDRIDYERYSVRQRLLLEEGELFPGVAKKLSSLQEQYHLVIVTATSSKLVKTFLNKEGIDHYFTLVLGKDDPQYKWENVENKASLLLEVSGQIGIPLDRFVYIGDNTSDYIASKQVGVRFIEAAQTAIMVKKDSLIQVDDAIKYRFKSFDDNDTRNNDYRSLDNILRELNNEK